MPIAGGGQGGDAHRAAARKRQLLLFVLFDLAFVLLVLLPSLIYLFVLDNDLSERELVLYVVALVVMQALVTGLLLRKFRIIPGQPTED